MTDIIKVDHEYIEATVRRFAAIDGVDEAEIERRIKKVTAAHVEAVDGMKSDMADMLATPDDDPEDYFSSDED